MITMEAIVWFGIFMVVSILTLPASSSAFPSTIPAFLWSPQQHLLGSVAMASSEDLLLLGVSPEDYKYYQDGWSSSSHKLRCKDGSKQFTKSQFNDDFCDCSDGTDEPGTSACPFGKFYCKNAGHVPLSIYSSRVNDGICDCCDGSDEYVGRINCTNTCWEAGKAARDKLKKKIATYQQGATIRKSEVEQAKVAITKEEAELSKLKSEEKILKGLVEQLKERKEQIERAEEKERLQKEKEEKERKEAEEAAQKENNDENKADAPEVKPTGDDIHGHIGVPEDSTSSEDVVDEHENSLVEDEGALKDEEDSAGHLKEDPSQHASKIEEATEGDDQAVRDTGNEDKGDTENTESLSREELGRLVGSRWTGENVETKESDATSSIDQENSEELADSHDEDDNSYETDDEEHRYGDDDESEDQMEDVTGEDHADSLSSYKSESDDELDFSEIHTESNPSWLEKIHKTVRKILQAVSFIQGPVDKSEAERVRKEYDESSMKLSKIQSRISSLTKKLKQDFGPEMEFYSFYGQCFEIKQNKYVYKICPFKEASQTEGYSTTRLGNWDKFEDSYRTMQFANGDKCWNGPDRSLKVKLRCGLKNEVTDVDEPSRCEYLALFATPLVCHEAKLKELRDKLEMIDKESPQAHDEL